MSNRPATQTLSRLRTGPLIREARRRAGLSQAALAGRLATKQSVISRWERGLETPRIETLARILHACGFEADLTLRRHDDVDRAQLRENLAMTPAQRLASVRNASELAAKARRLEPAGA